MVISDGMIAKYFYHAQYGDLDGTCNILSRRAVTECCTLHYMRTDVHTLNSIFVLSAQSRAVPT